MAKLFELKQELRLEGRLIGPGHPVFVIAEIGVNHNGDYDTAVAMIDAAVACGADCVKFQTFRAEEFMADRSVRYEYESAGKKVSENMFDMFKRLELPSEWHEKLFTYARSKKVVPLTSVADPESADLVERIGGCAFKLSSEDFVNLPLLKHVAGRALPLILSTGMVDEGEIDGVMNLLRGSNKQDVAFLHCVSMYPTPVAEAHLARITALRDLTGGIVGYSDHTEGTIAAVGAVALGACIIEKHFTLDRNMEGPDHALSVDPAELKTLVSQVREMELMRGNDTVAISAVEQDMRKLFRRSIVAARDLEAGHVIEECDLVVQRPGTGLTARHMDKFMGKTLAKNLKRGECMTPEIVS